MIHFSNGQSPVPVVTDTLGADLLRGAARVHNATETPANSTGDSISVKSINAALELGLMNQTGSNSQPAAGAADYQIARTAAVNSEPVTSMQHLEMAVHESPAYASVALQDPAFHAMRAPVQELVDRVSFVAGTSQSAGAGTYQPTRITGPSAEGSMAAEQPAMMGPQSAVAAPHDPQSASAHSNAAVTSPSVQATPDITGATITRPVLSSPQPSGSVPSLPQAPVPATTSALPSTVPAAFDLELINSWDTPAARGIAASEYQVAVSAVQAGDRPSALQHLEQSILANPAQAAKALVDPAFDTIRASVRDLVARMTVDLRVRAEGAISEARLALQSPGTPGSVRPMQLAHAYLQAAQASLQLGTYTGLVQAAFAAELASQITNGTISLDVPAFSWGPLEPFKRVLKQATQRLWRRLPLLAILLGWFGAGVLAGIVSLLFEAGVSFRTSLFPAWGLGMITIVLVGFVRSIRRITQRWT